jgi:hypothetical protein
VFHASKSHNEWVSMGADLVRISKIGNLLEHFPRFTYQISALWSEHRIVLFSPSRYLVVSAFEFFEHIGWGQLADRHRQALPSPAKELETLRADNDS